MNKVSRFYRNYFRGRYYHVRRYLDSLDFGGKYSKADLEKIGELKGKAEVEMRGVRRFQIISIVIYLAIYFFIVNCLFSDFIILGTFVAAAREFVTFVGAPIFVVAQLLVTRLKNIRFEKLSLYTSHLVAFSVKR